ncbi:MAG: AAA family ATPase, partial [Acholeplasma sp.]|nr:AAA family ATPase [Acholeplasma sp.]
FSCKNDDYFLKHQSKLLHDFDTGIDDINMVDVSLDELEKIESKFFVEQCLSEFQKNSDKQEIYIRRSYKSENVYAFINKNNQLVVKKMLYKHLGESYDFFEESTGTKKIIDLYDIFLSIDRTVIIDEIDRSFHHNLTVEFINKFLSTSKNSQLIVTTHDPLLMDLQLFRRDSFWFVERCSDNSSSLYPLEKFKPRFDKIVYKDYLAGRYNAIPCLSGNEDD